jgi:transketolase
MLLYSLLHLTGYDLIIEDIKNFRLLGSKTPCNPENFQVPGVETTTGPLGQGLANAVGMAIAEKVLSERFNKKDCHLIDHNTYVFLGDGCLMEGISHEVSSLAGTLKLGKLIAFWDDNSISIDGNVEGWFTENVVKRYEAYGWNVIGNVNGHDFNVLNKAIALAHEKNDKPTLICCKTTIGKGSPNKSGSHGIHGSPLGIDEIEETRKALGWNFPPFELPESVYQDWNHSKEGEAQEQLWKSKLDYYKSNYQEDYCELTRRINSKLPQSLPSDIDNYIVDLLEKKPSVATRKSSQMALEVFLQKFA